MFGGYHTVFWGVNETPGLVTDAQTVNFSTKSNFTDAVHLAMGCAKVILRIMLNHANPVTCPLTHKGALSFQK